MSYLTWLFVFIGIPTAIIWYFNYPLLWRYKKTLSCVMLAALVVSTTWDLWAVSRGVWIFPQGGHLGTYLLGIPMEEYLFFTTVTLLIASVVLVVKYRTNKTNKPNM